MDPQVLKAQQWVNATYGGVNGYHRAPEDGRTGSATFAALINGLQHELGITSLSDTFGPATLGRLTDRGGIAKDDADRNLVFLVQCGLYCKGYDPGGITGTFGAGTTAAVSRMMTDAGVGALGSAVPPKVVKGLLSTDAYVLRSGGTAAVRLVQQWLNGRYLPRANSFVGPCDGVFSRDVQRALYLAIQYELGLTDAQATGTFGPTTQAGLRQHPLAQGATGVWVQLFSAAVVVNRVAVGGGTYATFTATYAPALTAAVRAFQTFTQLPVTGRADFATWCQLLVSTGDPDRPGTACDCVTTITDARAKALAAAGYRFVGRYLDQTPGGVDKAIQPGELATIFRHGLRVFPISQYGGGDVTYFTAARGRADAVAAHGRAAGYGFPKGTVLYFAVDYDATQADLDAHVLPYFQGVAAGLAARGGRFVHGVYGSRNVCAQVSARTKARWSFVSGMSTGYSGNMGFALPGNWAFNQVQTRTVGVRAGAVEIDKDVYRTGTDPGTSAVAP